MVARCTLAGLWLGLFFAVGAFGQATGLILGTARDGSGAVIPGAWNLDLGLFKNFNVSEGVNLQYRWEMFNAMNHANLTNPVGRIISGTAGEINTLTGPRIMQMGLRIEF